MVKKIYFSIILIVLAASVSYAQQSGPSISWDLTVFDFGVIEEKDGPQTAKFEFVNTGSEALYIISVRASCGCTTPEWSKYPIKPGEKGYVEAVFDPKNRPGKFNKSIIVTTNEFNPTSVLRIIGDVIPKTAQKNIN